VVQLHCVQTEETDYKNVFLQPEHVLSSMNYCCLTWFQLFVAHDEMFLKHDVHGSMHHSTIYKEKSNKIQQCIKKFIIPYLYEAQHVSGDTPPIIRSLKLHWQPLVFHTWKVVGHVAFFFPFNTHTHTHTHIYIYIYIYSSRSTMFC
jgi:hypothetical protein